MWHGWMMAAFQKTFYMANWQQEKDQQDDPPTTLQGRMQARPQAFGINTDSWEVTATDRDAWRHTLKVGLSQYEETQRVKAEEKRLHKKTVCLARRPTTAFTCSKCDRDCHSRIDLHSLNIRCTMGANLWSFETDRCQWWWKPCRKLKPNIIQNFSISITYRGIYNKRWRNIVTLK